MSYFNIKLLGEQIFPIKLQQQKQKSVESQEKFCSIGFSDTRDENGNDVAKFGKELNEKSLQISKLKDNLKSMNQYSIENETLKKDIQLKEKEINYLRNYFKQQNVKGQDNEEVQKLHQYIKDLQDQVLDKVKQEIIIYLYKQDQQLKDQLGIVQHVMKNELQDELFQIRSEQMLQKKQYENQIQELNNQLCQYQENYDMLAKRYDEEKQQLIESYNYQVEQLNLQQKQYLQLGENNSWKDRVLKFEVNRENELQDMKKQLETLKKSLINFPEIEINAERKAYEATILQLNNRIRELESGENGQFNQHELLQQEMMNLNDQIFKLKNDKQYLEIKLNQQANLIQNLQDSLAATQQQLEQRKKQKEEMITFGSNRREHYQPIYNSPSNQYRQYTYEQQQQQYIVPAPIVYPVQNSNLFNTPYSRNGRNYHSNFYYPQEINQRNYTTSQIYTIRNNNQEMNNEILYQKQEISQKLNEIEDVKRKYQRALGNIQKLEGQVMDKLQGEELIIE